MTDSCIVSEQTSTRRPTTSSTRTLARSDGVNFLLYRLSWVSSRHALQDTAYISTGLSLVASSLAGVRRSRESGSAASAPRTCRALQLDLSSLVDGECRVHIFWPYSCTVTYERLGCITKEYGPSISALLTREERQPRFGRLTGAEFFALEELLTFAGCSGCNHPNNHRLSAGHPFRDLFSKPSSRLAQCRSLLGCMDG